MWDTVYPYLAAILPTIGLCVIAYVVFRAIFQADRNERKAVAQWEAQRENERRRGAADSDPH